MDELSNCIENNNRFDCIHYWAYGFCFTLSVATSPINTLGDSFTGREGGGDAIETVSFGETTIPTVVDLSGVGGGNATLSTGSTASSPTISGLLVFTAKQH